MEPSAEGPDEQKAFERYLLQFAIAEVPEGAGERILGASRREMAHDRPGWLRQLAAGLGVALHTAPLAALTAFLLLMNLAVDRIPGGAFPWRSNMEGVFDAAILAQELGVSRSWARFSLSQIEISSGRVLRKDRSRFLGVLASESL